jgi:hypothetical protein
LKARQRADGGDVGVHEPSDLARHEIDVAVREQQPEVLTEIGDGGAGDRSTDVEDDRSRPGRGPQAFERCRERGVGRGQENLLGSPFPGKTTTGPETHRRPGRADLRS